MPRLALMPAKPHIFWVFSGHFLKIFWSAQGVQRRLMGISGFCMHTSAQLFYCAKTSPASRLRSSPAHKFPEDESSAALGAQQYHLLILPGALGSKAFVLPTAIISSDKRPHQKLKPGLLCGSAEFYTQSTLQADLCLIWVSFAVLIFKSKNVSITI